MSMFLGSGTKAAGGDVEIDEAAMFMAVEDSIPLSSGYQRSGPPRGALNPDIPIKDRELFQFHTSPNPVPNELVTIELLQGALGEASPTEWNLVSVFGVFTGDPLQQTVIYNALTDNVSFNGSVDFPLRDRWSFNVPNGDPMFIDGQIYLIVFEWNV